jgi:hypothetical protein
VPESLFLSMGARQPAGAMNIVQSYRLEGPLDDAALVGALGDVLHRHDVLRTGYVRSPGGGWGAELAPGQLTLEVEKRSASGARDLELAVAREAARPFDVGTPPLLRPVLFELGPHDHVLVLVLHHVIADASAVSILIDDVALEYQRRCEGHDERRPLPVQYAEYAAWEAQRMSEEFLEDATAYWTRQLAGAQFAQLGRIAEGTTKVEGYTALTVELGSSLSEAVHAAAEREQASDFMVLLASYMLVLHELTGLRDLTVPSVFTTRVGPRFQEVVGAMVNGVAVRASVDPSSPKRSLRAVRDSCLETLAYYHVPRSVIQTALLRSSRGRVRAGGASMRFQVAPARKKDPEFLGLDVSRSVIPPRTYGADIEVSVVDWPDRPILEAAFRTDRIGQPVVERLLEEFVRTAGTAWAELGSGGARGSGVYSSH